VIVAKTKLQMKFAGRDGKRSKSLTFEISTPDRCTLKDDPMDRSPRSMSNDGFISGWVSGNWQNGSGIPDADVMTGDEIRAEGKLEELLLKGLQIEYGTTVVCDQCDDCSIEPNEDRSSDGRPPGSIFRTKGLRPDEIDLGRLRQWRSARAQGIGVSPKRQS
jgi:hypothetical protein